MEIFRGSQRQKSRGNFSLSTSQKIAVVIAFDVYSTIEISDSEARLKFLIDFMQGGLQTLVPSHCPTDCTCGSVQTPSCIVENHIGLLCTDLRILFTVLGGTVCSVF